MESMEVFVLSESAAWVWTRCKCSRSWNNAHTKSPTPGLTVCCDTGVETEGDDWICILFVTLHSKVSPFVSRLLTVDLSWGELCAVFEVRRLHWTDYNARIVRKRAAAEFSISFLRSSRTTNSSDWTLFNELGKPLTPQRQHSLVSHSPQ